MIDRDAETGNQVITIYLLIGFIFVPAGLFTLRASHSVVEIEERYDIECVPETFRNDKVSYIQDESIPKNCSLVFKVDKYMKAPIYIYYQLDNYYQNHRRYFRSRSDQQLSHGRNSHGTSFCRPVESNNNRPIVPCGLIAWSLFDDTFTFIRGKAELKVNRTNIAWKSDRDHKFGKNVYPFNFQNGTWIGGGKPNPRIPAEIRLAGLHNHRGWTSDPMEEVRHPIASSSGNFHAWSWS